MTKNNVGENSNGASCIFCKIVNREIPSEIIDENDDLLAFMDIAPSNFGHTLIIPKKHYPNIYELPNELVEKMARESKKLAIAIKKAVGADGVNVISNNDAASGQVVFHAHIHIVPRLKDDGYKWWGHRKYEDGQMEETGEKIRGELK